MRSLLLLALLAPRALSPAGDAPRLVSGGAAAPGAWLAVWRGEALVWWGADRRWQRLELAGVVDVSLLRAEFTGGGALVLGDMSEGTWLIVQGDPQPRPVADAVIPRQTPRTLACSDEGPLPVATNDALELAERPCDAPACAGPSCAPRAVCVRPGRAPAVRPPIGLRLRAEVALQVVDGWRTGAATTTGVQLLAVLVLGLDRAGVAAARRERADLQAQARPALRTLPALHSRGPLAAREREALAAILCGAAAP